MIKPFRASRVCSAVCSARKSSTGWEHPTSILLYSPLPYTYLPYHSPPSIAHTAHSPVRRLAYGTSVTNAPPVEIIPLKLFRRWDAQIACSPSIARRIYKVNNCSTVTPSGADDIPHHYTLSMFFFEHVRMLLSGPLREMSVWFISGCRQRSMVGRLSKRVESR